MVKTFLRHIFSQSLKHCRGLGLGRFRALRLLEKTIRANLITDFAEVMGHQMYLDPKDTLDLSINRVYEPFETSLVLDEVREGEVVLDIGAHIGYYTLIFAKLVGPLGKVFAFEPEPENFALLAKNVAGNHYRNVLLIRKAVSNKEGKASLYLSEDTTGDHRIFDSGDARQSVEIDTLDLDAYFRDYTGRIDFIKMDIQGAEDAALCGTVKLLETHGVERILMEFWPTGLKAYGVRPDAPLRLLESKGFHILDLDEPEQCVVRRTIPKLVDKYTSGRRTWTNLFCIRGNALRTWRDKYPQRGGRL